MDDDTRSSTPFPSSSNGRLAPLRASSSSDFLIVNRVDGPGKSLSLPRPQLWFLLPSFGLVDILCSIVAARSLVLNRNIVLLLGWGCARAAAICAGTCSIRIRQMGWVVVVCALLSILAALADLNLIIQNRAWLTSPRGPLIAYCLSHLFFGVLHWVAFAAVVGVGVDRNPYGLGLRATTFPAWREGVCEVDISNEAHMTDTNSPEAVHEAEYEGFVSNVTDSFSDIDDDAPIDDAVDESDTDPDDIIDIIPSPSVARHRKISQSRSFRSVSSLRARRAAAFADAGDEDEQAHGLSTSELSPLASSKQYGTFRSLGGI